MFDTPAALTFDCVQRPYDPARHVDFLLYRRLISCRVEGIGAQDVTYFRALPTWQKAVYASPHCNV